MERASSGGIAVGPTMEAAPQFAPFDLIVDSVGGSALSAAMTMLRKNGVCVTLGRSEGEDVRFNVVGLLDAPGASLQSLVLFDDIAATEPASEGLAILARLMEERVVTPTIGVEAPWSEVAPIARQLIDRAFAGKAVLHVTA